MNRRNIEAGILLLFAVAIVGLLGSLFVIESPEERKLILPCLVGAVMGLVSFAGFLVFGRGAADPDSPTVVASLPDEMSASALVVQLGNFGIKAQAVGGYTAGFQTEVASDVRVVVAARDVDAAMKLLKP
jgi:hypothetical protein